MPLYGLRRAVQALSRKRSTQYQDMPAERSTAEIDAFLRVISSNLYSREENLEEIVQRMTGNDNGTVPENMSR